MRKCVRCRGMKRLYKLGNGYTITSTGGKEVTCPLCMGSGRMPSEKQINDALAQEENNDDKDIKKENIKKRKIVSRKEK